MVNFAEAEPLFPEFLTGTEMLALFAAAKGAPKGQEVYFIESMNMQSYINRPIGTYSSGMLKKLSLLLAFIGHPQLILLDEPLITIDTDALMVLYKWINKLNAEDGVSFMLSSHQILDAEIIGNTSLLEVENQSLKILGKN